MASDPFREMVEEMIAESREVVNGDPDSVRAIRAVADASLGLLRLGRCEDALAEIEAVLAKHGDAEDPGLRGAARHVLSARAQVLRELGRAEEAAVVASEVAERAGEGVPPPHSDEALQAMCSRAKELIDAEQLIEAAEVLSEALEPYELDLPPAAQTIQVIDAITLLQSMAASSGDLDALLRSCAEIVRRFASTSDPAVRERVADALWNWAFYADYAGDDDQAAELRLRYEAYVSG